MTVRSCGPCGHGRLGSEVANDLPKAKYRLACTPDVALLLLAQLLLLRYAVQAVVHAAPASPLACGDDGSAAAAPTCQSCINRKHLVPAFSDITPCRACYLHCKPATLVRAPGSYCFD